MDKVKITLKLPEALVRDAQEYGVLTEEVIAQLLQAEVDRRRVLPDSEEAWEETVLTETLGDALKPDGSIDFAKLRATGLTLTLDELHSDGNAVDDS
jgi:hypothetical protein